MPATENDLWNLVLGPAQIDAGDLAAAVEECSKNQELDYRTRLLVRDSLDALKSRWGQERMASWLTQCSTQERLKNIWQQEFERPGFRSIGNRLMDKTEPTAILGFLRELGVSIAHPMRLNVGGSAVLILQGLATRHTEDIDIVNEVPRDIREQHALLDDLKKRYGLLLTHFASHYLPTGWENRLNYLDVFGNLRVYLVDAIDIFVGKLFSNRTKDLDDLRMLVPRLRMETIRERFRDATTALRADSNLLALAQKNWYILFGEALPT